MKPFKAATLLLLIGGLSAGLAARNPAFSKEVPPPALASFDIQAPDAVTFARLWLDVGMFHPFTGKVTRQDWDKTFYALLNQVAEGKLPLREAAASAIGALGDTGSMVLSSDEGTGSNILPLIFEARRDGIWIVGGSRAAIHEPFGPLAGVNRAPVARFMASHIGANTSLDQQIAALVAASQTIAPRNWTFSLADGRTLAVESTSKLPTDAWIDGGWHGTPVHQLASMAPADIMTKIDALDLRTLNWAPAVPSVQSMLFLLSRVAFHDTPFNETRWFHKGFSNGVPTNEYTSALTTTGLFVPANGPNSKRISVTLPAPFLASRNATWAMAGWAVPKDASLPGERTTYALSKDVQVRLVTTFLSDTAPDQAKSLFGGPIEFFSPDRPATWNVLSIAAAKNLAAATILDFVEHFGFIRTDDQEAAFKAIADLPLRCSTVHDLLLQASRFLKEPHSTAMVLDYRDLAPGDWESGAATKHSRLPFIGRTHSDGTMDVLKVSASAPMKVGAIVTAINGRPMKDLIAEMASRVPTPENEFRICKDLGMLFPYDTPLSISFRNPGEKERTEKVDPVTYDGPWQPEDPSILQALAKAGWTYIGDPKQLDSSALLKGLKEGKNYLLDLRTTALIPSTNESPYPVTPIYQSWTRTPSAPMAWGRPSNHPFFSVDDEQDGDVATGEHYPGKVATLVWGTTQSSMETAALLMKHRFLDHSYTVGTHTSGMTGGVAYIKLPIGESNRFEVFSPTGEWPIIEGISIQYREVPLDVRFSHTEIQKALASGSEDPYITVFLKHLGELR